MTRPHPRRRSLPNPGLQLRLIATFAGVSVLSLMLQHVFLTVRLSELADSVPIGGEYVADRLPGVLVEMLLWSLGVFLPLVFGVGVMVTFRIAGPLFNIQRYLRRVADGEEVGECRIRKGDQLQELCDLVNLATAPARAQQSARAETDATDAGDSEAGDVGSGALETAA